MPERLRRRSRVPRGAPIVFTPRPTAAQPVALDERELQRALAQLGRGMRQNHGLLGFPMISPCFALPVPNVAVRLPADRPVASED
jgi:hypothetical protein